MIKKIILIGYQPLTEKVKVDFYFENLKQKGLEVVYWDLSQIFFPNILKDCLSDDRIKKINNYCDLEHNLAIQNVEECLYVLHITYEFRVVKLFRLLTKYNSKISFFARGALPVCINKDSIWDKLSKALNPVLLSNFIKNKYAIFLKNIGKIKCYNLIFCAGELGYLTVGCGSQFDKNFSKTININSLDYDTFLSTSNLLSIVDGKYCLFLDEYLPHHPDFELLGITTMDPQLYYKGINDFFDCIEKKFNVEVVIAAHPKAEKYKRDNYFNGRKVFFNETSRLSRFCEFTIAHISTSQSYSVLNNKPIISITSNIMKEIMPQYDRFIKDFSSTLGTRLINTDSFLVDDFTVFGIDIEKYNQYKYRYLTSKISERVSSFECFYNTIKE